MLSKENGNLKNFHNEFKNQQFVILLYEKTLDYQYTIALLFILTQRFQIFSQFRTSFPTCKFWCSQTDFAVCVF